MIVFLIILVVLLAICWIPTGIWIQYIDGNLTMKAVVGGFKIPLYQEGEPPKPKKVKKRKKPAKPKKAKAKRPKLNLSLREILDILGVLRDFSQRTGRQLYAEKLEIAVNCGGSDAARTAIGYGKICAILAGLEPLLDRIFRVRHKNIQANLDFSAEKVTVTGLLDLRLRIGSAVYLAVYMLRHGVKFLTKRKRAM